MKSFYGTIEYLPGGRSAIIELTDSRGGWQGAQRIELPRAKRGRSDLYELGYTTALQMAALKKGVLETFRGLAAPPKEFKR